MVISSPAFDDNGKIPAKYGHRFDDVSPPLAFADIPPSAQSLALIMDDPDAPGGTFTHWVVYNISTQTAKIAQGETPNGAIEGTTGYGQAGYGGPMPPSGTHSYEFKLFALDKPLDLPAGATSQELSSAMDGHVLAKAKLTGAYPADNS